MEIRPGLNILIGPNGSGKSNIISYFQFLSRLARTGLSDAVSLTGGAGAFFQKTGETKYTNRVTAVTRGLTFVEEIDKSDRAGWMLYEYRFGIHASERFDSIIFSEQEIRLSSIGGVRSDVPAMDALQHEYFDWDLVIESSTTPAHARVVKLSDGWLAREASKAISRKDILDQFDRDISEASFESISLIRLRSRFFNPILYIAGDFLGGETLSIDPAEVKRPEDSAREPGIRSDGSGLAATLWHMLNEPTYKAYDYPYYSRPRNFQYWRGRGWAKVYKQLQSLIQLVNSQIQNVYVTNEPFDNQLKIKVRMEGPRGDVDLPLSAMSDGTIKWASLITAILTHRSIFAIEEPENFLHPLMLTEIVKLMRESTSEKFSFVIMTTHSETLLNAASPYDVIVVSMEHGITRGRRPANPDQLLREIQETGFGLGHYYLAGDLSDA
ncbi:AAA family ATPase [Hypericibacter terrae]